MFSHQIPNCRQIRNARAESAKAVEVGERARIYSDFLYRLWIRRDMRSGATGEMAAHDVERWQVREGDGDEEREDESTEEEEEAWKEKCTGSHDFGE